MNDLTRGSIPRHIVALAAPIAIGMLFQALYYVVDLYFVGTLGETALAGVSAGGTLQFLIMAMTQVLGVGTMALIAHAAGRKDRDDANLLFNQSLVLAAVCAGITLVGGYTLSGWYMSTLGADAETTAAGTTYLLWVMPGFALQFALISMGSALRGTGITKPTMVVQIGTVLMNTVLTPVMVAGWGTGRPLGVVGAALSSSISVATGVVLMAVYFVRLEKFVQFDTSMIRPRLDAWTRILKIGMPPGGEFAILFVFVGVTYWIIRDFGASAQAGYGVGSRVMQAIFLPAMAVAFATAPVAGQNMGAGHADRVRETLRSGLVIGSVLMFTVTLVCQVAPAWFIGFFTEDAEAIRVGAEFLRYISWTFVATGIVFTCSSLFQALGNTLPSFLASVIRLLAYVVPGVWMSHQHWFQLHHLWMLSIATVIVQATVAFVLLRFAFRRKLSV